MFKKILSLFAMFVVLALPAIFLGCGGGGGGSSTAAVDTGDTPTGDTGTVDTGTGDTGTGDTGTVDTGTGDTGTGDTGTGDTGTGDTGTTPPVVVDAVIEAGPTSYDFGTVTPGNLPAPVEVVIHNTGTDPLEIASLTLSDTVDFSLDRNGGSNPCGTGSIALAADDSCTLALSFGPQALGAFTEHLAIASNARNSATTQLTFVGTYEPITSLNLRINQLESCPRPVMTAYVSVTDQANYPVTQLTASDFTLTEGTTPVGSPSNTVFVQDTASLAVTLVMDYSGSVSSLPAVVSDMEESAAAFVNQMDVDDEAEIIKFADNVDVVQDFLPGTTEGKAALVAAIQTPYVGVETNLYDALYQAIDDTAAQNRDRRAVIVLSDGRLPTSTYTQDDVLNYAREKGVPIFAVGLGSIDLSLLTAIADGTGGQVYQSPSSDNLSTIYQQLSDLLFFDQYILTYDSPLAAGDSTTLTIRATLGGISGEAVKEIPACQ